MRSKLSELILQIIPVMIGVYLGFLISNWGEQQKMQNQSIVLLESIKNELAANKEKLTNVLDYHKILRDSSRYYLRGDSSLRLTGPPPFFRGIQTSTLFESAYGTGKQTGIISEFELSTIQELNQLYAYQQEYNEYIKITLEGLINLDFDSREESIRKILQFISISMADIVVKEEILIAEYERIPDIIK